MNTHQTTTKIREAVITCVSELMTRSGRSCQIADDIDVISGLGLTSEDGVELACMLEASLNICIPKDANPLIEESKGRQHSRSIQQVCDAVSAWAVQGGAQ